MGRRRFSDMETPEQKYLAARAKSGRAEAGATETRLANTAFPGGKVPAASRAKADAAWERAEEDREQAEQLGGKKKRRWF